MDINFNLIHFENEPLEKQQLADLSEEFDFPGLLAQASNEKIIVDLQDKQPNQDDLLLPQVGKSFPYQEFNVEDDSISSEDLLSHTNQIVKLQNNKPNDDTDLKKDLVLIEISEISPELIAAPIQTPEGVAQKTINQAMLIQSLYTQGYQEKNLLAVDNLLAIEQPVTPDLDNQLIQDKLPLIPIEKQVMSQKNDDVKSLWLSAHPQVMDLKVINLKVAQEVASPINTSFTSAELNDVNVDMQNIKHIYDETRVIDFKAIKYQESAQVSDNNFLTHSINQKSTMEAISNQQVNAAEKIETRSIGQDLFSRVSLMVKSNETTARIQIDPPELGQMEIKITQSEDKAHILFISNVEATRNLIEANVDKLAMNLAQNGIDLGNVFVAQEDKHHAQPQPKDNHPELLGDVSKDVDIAPLVKQTSLSLIDIYV